MSAIDESLTSPSPAEGSPRIRLGEAPPGDPMLAVHGITANSHSWLAVARALDGRASACSRVDLRGRGASSGFPARMGWRLTSQRLLAVLDSFGLERAVLVGHSLGALHGRAFAADHPERSRGGARRRRPDGAAARRGRSRRRSPPPCSAPRSRGCSRRSPAARRITTGGGAHPAFANGDERDEDLVAYADHDLVGEPPALRSSVGEEVVRADAAELLEIGKPAHRLAGSGRVAVRRARHGRRPEPDPARGAGGALGGCGPETCGGPSASPASTTTRS